MTKKLIDRLEELADEMKVIVHQLRGPSTIVEDVIEFEGQQYKKVDREARDGDVVVPSTSTEQIKAGCKYKVTAIGSLGPELSTVAWVYDNGRTLENVTVYELMDGYNPHIPILEESNVKSPNQQRAEVITKAKEFVEKNEDGFKFVVNERAVNCIRAELGEDDHWMVSIGKSKCMPTDVFNEHIGKAIALGRALNLDVSEFENAVQPTELVKGHEIRCNKFGHENVVHATTPNVIVICEGREFYHGWRWDNGELTIINDTNAEYEVKS